MIHNLYITALFIYSDTEKTCEVLSNPDNGVVKFSDKQNENSKATFKCKAGFVRVGVKTLVCQSGLWNNDPPVCEGKDIYD